MVLHTLPFSLHFTCFDLTLNYGKFPSFPFPTFFPSSPLFFYALLLDASTIKQLFFSFSLLLFYLLLYYMYFFACFLSDTEPSLDFCCTDKPRRSRTPPHTVARTTNVLCRAYTPLLLYCSLMLHQTPPTRRAPPVKFARNAFKPSTHSY